MTSTLSIVDDRTLGDGTPLPTRPRIVAGQPIWGSPPPPVAQWPLPVIQRGDLATVTVNAPHGDYTLLLVAGALLAFWALKR